MHPQAIRSKPAVMIAVLAVCVSCPGQNRAVSTAPATQPALDPTVDRILTSLESREVRDLRADVSWRLMYVLDEAQDAVVKKGQLWYQQQPIARFLVHFTHKISANRRHDLDERHMFDGRWYVKLSSEARTLTRTEVRREGDVRDPYKLGEGPFPMPFGQRKADILKEFQVTLVPPGKDDPPGTDHLRLVPRAGTQTGRRHKRVDVWVARTGPNAGLPIKVHTAKKDGTGKVNSYLTIEFRDVRLNRGFSGDIFEIKRPSGYDLEEQPLAPIEPPPGASPRQPGAKPPAP